MSVTLCNRKYPSVITEGADRSCMLGNDKAFYDNNGIVVASVHAPANTSQAWKEETFVYNAKNKSVKQVPKE